MFTSCINLYQRTLIGLSIIAVLLAGTVTASAQFDPSMTIRVDPHPKIASVDFSADGERLAVAGDGVAVWNANTGERIRALQTPTGGYGDVTFSPDGKWIATDRGSFSATVWDARTGEEVRTVRNPEPTTSRYPSPAASYVSFSPDSQSLLVGDFAGGLVLWDVETGAMLRNYSGRFHDRFPGLRQVEFLPNGRQAFVAGNPFGLVDLDANEIVYQRDGGLAVSLSQDGKRALTYYHCWPKVFHVQTGEVIREFELGDVVAGALSPHGKIAVIGGSGPEYPRLVVNVDTGEVLRSYPVTSSEDDHPASKDDIIAFAPDGRRFVTVNGEERHELHALHFWDISDLVTAVEDAELYDHKE